MNKAYVVYAYIISVVVLIVYHDYDIILLNTTSLRWFPYISSIMGRILQKNPERFMYSLQIWAFSPIPLDFKMCVGIFFFVWY